MAVQVRGLALTIEKNKARSPLLICPCCSSSLITRTGVTLNYLSWDRRLKRMVPLGQDGVAYYPASVIYLSMECTACETVLDQLMGVDVAEIGAKK
jgi:hypothetical protein